MKHILVAAIVVLAACGGNPDESVSTVNQDPDSSIAFPSDEELQEQLVRSEAFAETLIGMTENGAIAAIAAEGLIARVVARDGEYFMVTEDYSVSRINLEIENDRVTRATVG
jgi:hypothetical protein